LEVGTQMHANLIAFCTVPLLGCPSISLPSIKILSDPNSTPK
jgi:hypothetical protein